MQQHHGRDHKVDGGRVNLLLYLGRAVREVDVVSIDKVFHQHVQQTCKTKKEGDEGNASPEETVFHTSEIYWRTPIMYFF